MRETGIPLVSVIIPLYNNERFISQCLDSITQDPYPSKEIIVLNDGSTDNSLDLVQEWYLKNEDKFSGFFKLKTRENRGICKTLNDLVLMAQGEYIVLLASDDFLLPGGIQARLDYLQEHPDKLAVFADCIVVDGNNNLLCRSGIEDFLNGRKRCLIDDILCGYELVFRWCVPGPVFMAKRETYRIVGLYDESLQVEDWDYYIRLISMNLLGFIDYPVAAYRLHDKNNMKMLSKIDLITWPLNTVSKNLNRLTGIKRFRLISIKIRKMGEKYFFNRNFVLGITYRILAKSLEIFVQTIYEIKVIIRMNCNKKT